MIEIGTNLLAVLIGFITVAGAAVGIWAARTPRKAADDPELVLLVLELRHLRDQLAAELQEQK